jgi:hypothetical protein
MALYDSTIFDLPKTRNFLFVNFTKIFETGSVGPELEDREVEKKS